MSIVIAKDAFVYPAWSGQGGTVPPVPPPIIVNTRMPYRVITADQTVGVIDLGSFYAANPPAADITVTLAPAAELANGFWAYLTNTSAFDVNLAPSGAELIDGLAGYQMYPSETRLLVCDGTGFHTLVLHSFYKIFTASEVGGFIKPPGYRAFAGLAWGGGGGGGKSGGAAFAGGGGGGGCHNFYLEAGMLGATENVVIGAGGAGGAGAGPVDGVIGGNTSLGAHTLVYGGGAGGAAGAGTGGGVMSAGTTGGLPGGPALAGGSDAFGGVDAVASTMYGGARGDSVGTVWGGGGGGSGEAAPDPVGPTSFGGAGGAGGDAVAGGDGTAPGGGGGGTRTGVKGGDGARGELRLWGV